MPDRQRPNAAHEEPGWNTPGPSSAGALTGAAGRTGHPGRRPHRLRAKWAATVAVLAGCGVVAGTATWSNLNATATNPSNSFATGTVQIATNSSSSAVLTLTAAKPGAVATGCIQVTYSGSLPANVKMFGTGAGTGLNQYLSFVVTRGTFSGSPSAGSCTGFSADSTNYIAAGPGVIYSGTLAGWPSSAGSALPDPTSAAPATWSSGSNHGYQLQVTVQSNSAGQGLTGSETFTFQADNT